ncbi:MAG TPA: PhzF family phenazine biosynthesis protein [Chthoniobacterales bacterium]|nr:PhzF family phenazine biosynthesis protein [Chthoniobacterales bacterium]
MSRRYEFVQVDVFAKKPLAGNPLAVFPDARGLSDEQMQALAREMNLSETTFILPREPEVEAKNGTRVRIFTVEEELPFAGHPTLGTALYLYSTAASGRDELSLDLNVGKIDIKFRTDSKAPGDRIDGAVFGEMRQRDPEFGPTISRQKLGDALRGGVEQIASEWPCQVVSTGLPFAIIPIRDAKALSSLQADLPRVGDVLTGTGAKFCYFIAREEREHEIRARMFFYGGEDPATGSAAGCAASWMVQHGWAKSDEQVLIHQGVEAKRPSEIFVRATREGDAVTNVRVGGYAAEVLHGVVTLPA